MRIRFLSVLTVLIASMAAPPTFAQLPTQKVLTLDLANEMAQEAIRVCRVYNQTATVVVVDSGNFVKALLHDDGADQATLDVARMKATSVIQFGGAPSGNRGGGAAGPDGCNAEATALAVRGAPPAQAQGGPPAGGGAPPPGAAPGAGAPPGAPGGAPGAAGGRGGGGLPGTIGPVFNVPGTLNVGGGQPIKIGDQLIGAIAVSGVTGGGRPVPQGDSGCACAGIAKVADRLR